MMFKQQENMQTSYDIQVGNQNPRSLQQMPLKYNKRSLTRKFFQILFYFKYTQLLERRTAYRARNFIQICNIIISLVESLRIERRLQQRLLSHISLLWLDDYVLSSILKMLKSFRHCYHISQSNSSSEISRSIDLILH